MVVCIRGVAEGDRTPPHLVPGPSKNSFAELLLPEESPRSSECKNIVIVMDALKQFSWQPLQWVLNHVIGTGCTITLLGVMPWLPLALFCKTWLDVWTIDDPGSLSAIKAKSEWMKDQKHQRIRDIIQLCEQKGAVPSIKVAMGYPLKLVVLEQITTLHASCVVIDRHLRKDKAFFAERLPSSVVMMNNDGGADMLRNKTKIDDLTPGESPATVLLSAEVILSEEVSELVKMRDG